MAIYYVDYSMGSDLSAGTSTGAAWKHCPGDSNASGNAAITLSAGDKVYFKKGVTYSGKITANGNGSGEDTRITYGVTDWTNGGSEYALMDANGDTCNFNLISKAYLDLFGLDAFGNASTSKWAVGTDNTSDHVRIYSCKVHDCYGDLIRMRESKSCAIHDKILYNEKKGTGSDFQSCIGLYGIGANSSEKTLVHNNELYDGEIDGMVFHGKYIDVYNNIVHGFDSNVEHGDGIVCNGLSTSTGYINIYGNLIYNCGQYIYLDPILTGRSVDHINIFNNVCYEIDMARNEDAIANPVCFCIAHGSGGTASYIYVENNTFIDGTVGVSLGGFTGNHIYVRNNILSQMLYATDRPVVVSADGTKTDIYFDYNQYQHHAGGTDVKYMGADKTFAEWRGSPYNQEAHGQEGDPLFNGRAGYDFILTSPSPCIGKATNSVGGGFTTDKNGVDRGVVWDIGAHEYMSEAPVMPFSTMLRF